MLSASNGVISGLWADQGSIEHSGAKRMGDIGADPKRVEILPARPVLPARQDPAPATPTPAPSREPAPARP